MKKERKKGRTKERKKDIIYQETMVIVLFQHSFVCLFGLISVLKSLENLVILNMEDQIKNQIHDATASKNQDRVKRLLEDDSAGDLVVSKALSLNRNFSFLSRISLVN